TPRMPQRSLRGNPLRPARAGFSVSMRVTLRPRSDAFACASLYNTGSGSTTLGAGPVMCLLALFYRVVEDAPLVVGANREEAYARGGEPPRILDGVCRA